MTNNSFVFVEDANKQHQESGVATSTPASALTPPRQQDELRSFQVFVTRVVSLFSADSIDTAFWEKLVPASGQHLPFVWDATISIGLLFLHPVYKVDNAWAMTIQYLEGPQLQAVKWYSRAVSRLKLDWDPSADHNLLALLSCMLFISCEFQQGNIASGAALLEHSQKLFRACISCHALAEPASSRTEALEHALIPFCSRHLISYAELGLPPLYRHYVRTKTSPPPEDARTHLISFQDELCNLLCRVNITVTSSRLIQNQPLDIARLKPFRDHLVNSLDDWHERLQASLSHMRGTLMTGLTTAVIDQETDVLYRYLVAYFYVARIQLSTCLSPDETVNDNYLHDFEAIVHQAASLHSSATISHRSSFPPFDFGIAPTLYFVATRCRHPVVRRRATFLLRAIPLSSSEILPPGTTQWLFLPIVEMAESVIAYEEGQHFDHDLRKRFLSVTRSPVQPMTPFAGSAVATLEESQYYQSALDTLVPEHRRVHHVQLITRPRSATPTEGLDYNTAGSNAGKRELALRLITYSYPDQHQSNGEKVSKGSGKRVMCPVVCPLPPHVAAGL